MSKAARRVKAARAAVSGSIRRGPVATGAVPGSPLSQTKPLLHGFVLSGLLMTIAQIQLPGPAQARGDIPRLLTDPYLQRPTEDSVEVAWVTEFPGRRHLLLYGEGVERLTEADLEPLAQGDAALLARTIGARAAVAGSSRLSRMREDAASRLAPGPPAGLLQRPLWRHSAEALGLRPGRRVPYRVLSVHEEGQLLLSDAFTLAPKPPRGQPTKILLTSDHQTKPMTPANLQKVAETVGLVDAVFFAGDLVDHPDRASHWFDDARGGAFFPALQGRAWQVIRARDGTEGRYRGAPILQHAPLYPVIGNHEVMGRSIAGGDLAGEFEATIPRTVAERAYEGLAQKVNPTGDPGIRERWILDNSFNLETYRELFTLPEDSPGGETYWAESWGDVRVIGLYVTRMWRPPRTRADRPGRYHEPDHLVAQELRQGWGQHIFERIDKGSAQYAWLEGELSSPAFKAAGLRIVLMHHPIHGVGANSSPPFTDPVRIETRDDQGSLSGIRYEYPRREDHLRRDLEPLLQRAGVDLVVNGHSHLWNRFQDGGVHYLETSNVGNSYGAYHERSGRSRPLPPPPWDPANATPQGDPNGLEPIVPNIRPQTGEDGGPLPFVASDELTVFSILDTGDRSVTSYAFDTGDPESEVFVLDRFVIGR